LQFTGYDIGTVIGQVSGCVSNMFPSDGGHIQTERTHFVKGTCDSRSVTLPSPPLDNIRVMVIGG